MTTIKMGDGHETNETIPEEEAKEAVETTEVETPEESSPSEETTDELTEEEPEEVAEEDTESGTEPIKESEEHKSVTKEEIDGLLSEKEKLSAQIVELRKERRGVKQGEQETPLFVPANEELEGVAPEDISLVEKILKAKGYVRKDEIQANSYKENVDIQTETWLEKHPEYKPENDPEDKKWNSLLSEYNLYKTPSDPKQIQKLLDKAHSSLNPRSVLPTKNPATIAAAKQKLAAKGSGGVGAKTSIKTKGNLDLSGLQGFTEEELAELQS